MIGGFIMGYQGSRGGGRRGGGRSGGGRSSGGRRGGRPGGGRFRRKRFCSFCVDKKDIDYKDYDTLRRYMNEYGRIKPRRQTGVCAKHQRTLAVSVKRARHLALLPFVVD
ncbi:MAG: 30S ribosomal protein S18 [Chloroflexi bacterium]|nr:30S ribosomal protein S18 [Chloroflexota bacterium]